MVFFRLLRCPLHTQVAEKAGTCLLQPLDTAQSFYLSLEKVAIGRHFLVCCGLSVLAAGQKGEEGVGHATEGRVHPRAFREGEVLRHIQDFREKFWSKFWISLYIFTSPSAQDREKTVSSGRLFLPNRPLG